MCNHGVVRGGEERRRNGGGVGEPSPTPYYYYAKTNQPVNDLARGKEVGEAVKLGNGERNPLPTPLPPCLPCVAL